MSDSDHDHAHAQPVLKASVHDISYLTTLLRGVNFANRATITATGSGFTVTVEEARTLLATAYIFADIFDEYVYHSEAAPSQQSQDDGVDNVAFEIPLNTLIECLNIFGTAGTHPSSTTSGAKRWKKQGEDKGSDEEEGEGANNKRRGIAQYFGAGPEKSTGMRLTYEGAGFPLTLLIAEEADGPTTACEIVTYDPEPHLDLQFRPDKMILKIILKSSWLRDALSELDPSCDKLTFIGNPPPDGVPPATSGRPSRNAEVSRGTSTGKPMLRIHADGTFGSTEMDYPNDRDVLETFECEQSVSFSYRTSHITRAIRALQNSTKTSLRIDSEGLMSMQFLMPSPSIKSRAGADAFIEFRCLPLEEAL
ncbi:rad1 family protein [Pleurotus pulmonarius]